MFLFLYETNKKARRGRGRGKRSEKITTKTT
jgi:hypothetical protein